jgi:hypothetical protein
LTQINPIAAANIPQELLQELDDFRKLCDRRYLFNSRADNCLNLLGLLISIGIVAAGVYKKSEYAALLGGVMTAIVSAQRAFPFNQRWNFYRLLASQAENLLTEAKNGVVAIEQAIATMKALRLDFAQQIPRGSSFRSDSGANIDAPGAASASASATAAH